MITRCAGTDGLRRQYDGFCQACAPFAASHPESRSAPKAVVYSQLVVGAVRIESLATSAVVAFFFRRRSLARTHNYLGKVVFICLGISVNLVSTLQGKPGATTVKHNFQPNGLKSHRRVAFPTRKSSLWIPQGHGFFPLWDFSKIENLPLKFREMLVGWFGRRL